jgi:hypothetical protein
MRNSVASQREFQFYAEILAKQGDWALRALLGYVMASAD